MGLYLNNVRLCRGRQCLFDDLSLTIESGELLQLVGNNGAGKSSLLAMMAGLLLPEQGCLLWDNKTIDARDTGFQRQLCYLGHAIAIKPQLTVLENIQYDYSLLGISRQSALSALDTLNLLDYRHSLAGELSRGQQQRLALARVRCSDARLLLLDEPLTALDPQSVEVVRAILLEKLQQALVIVLTSHQRLSFSGIESRYHDL